MNNPENTPNDASETRHLIPATPEAVTDALARVDFAASTLVDLARLVSLIEARWPLATLQALKARHASAIDYLDRYGPSEPIYQPPKNPTPIGPVLDTLDRVALDAFTPGHVDRIARALLAFGSPSTWRKFAALTSTPKCDAIDRDTRDAMAT